MIQVACDLCGADESAEVFPAGPDRGPVVRCASCGLVYQNPRNEMPLDWGSVYSDEEEAFYQAQYRHERQAKRQAANEVFELLERFRPEHGRLLEVGSATGFFLEVARERGWDVSGIEPHSAVARWSIDHLGLDVHIGSLEDQPWAAASFDAVVLYNTLEHLTSPSVAIRSVSQLLRPGGVVAIQVPKIDNPWARILGRRWRHVIRYHYYFFSENTLGTMLRRAGFDVLDARTAPKVVTLGFIADRLWEFGYVPRRTAQGLRNLLARRGLDGKVVRFDPRDDLLVHARRLSD